jgi:hypothetical protein
MSSSQPNGPSFAPGDPLGEADREAVDALLAARRGETPATRIEPERLARVQRLLSLLEADPVSEPPADLVDRTLDRVAGRSMPVIDRPVLRSSSASWGQVLAIAALLVAGVSLLWPVLSMTRAQARTIACASHLAQAGEGIARYAAEHGGVMPRLGSWPGTRWLDVGGEHEADEPIRSNAAHLYLLARDDYVSESALRCPENADAPSALPPGSIDWPSLRAVSYSYQNQYTRAPLRVEQDPAQAVLADKNPLFRERDGRAVHDASVSGRSPSRAHGGRGQNVLDLAGRVRFTSDPVLADGDNIWMLRNQDRYDGTEVPADPRDAFLVP